MVASAWRGGPAIRMEDYLTADGRPATRVVTATGTACYAMQANPLAGADPFNTRRQGQKSAVSIGLAQTLMAAGF